MTGGESAVNPQLRKLLAVILAAASAVLTILAYFSLRPAARKVVIARSDVQPFTLLTADLLDEVEVDAATAAKLFPQAYANRKELGMKVAFRHLRVGEVLTKDDGTLAEPGQPDRVRGARAPLSARLKAGHLAVAVPAANPGAAPGDYVRLFRVRAGEVRPVLSYPVQVVADQGGSLLLMVKESDLTDLLRAQSEGPLQAALAAPP